MKRCKSVLIVLLCLAVFAAADALAVDLKLYTRSPMGGR